MTTASEHDPFAATQYALVLASVSSPVEAQLVHQWLSRQRRQHPGCQVDVVTLGAVDDESAIHVLTKDPHANPSQSVVPVRVLWLPARKLTVAHSVAGMLIGRHPYRPSQRRLRKLLRHNPSRARVIVGEPATIEQLRQQWRYLTDGQDPVDFGRFVIRRAALALERVEYRLLGPQYKSPRLVKPEMLASSRFRAGLAQIPGATVESAGQILDEMATGWSRLSVDISSALFKFMFSRGFDQALDYDDHQLEAMRRGLQTHPVVMLFSHRSNLDGAVLTVALRENRMPGTHFFGGINMSFGFLGPLLRRSGVIFIRRNIGDDPLYKFVLKEYVGYLVQKRFTLSWSIEGTRSRTGKMLPPKLGLLSYVADAHLQGRCDDILLQPISISFDQLHETAEYAAYAVGGEKKREGLGWFYTFLKAQGQRHYGKIYIRFPEAVSMGQYLHAQRGADEPGRSDIRLALQKMAFEVAWRIQQATPVNATALVSALLLATRGVALTRRELHHTLQDSLDYLQRKQIPMTQGALALRTLDGVQATVDALSGGHPLTRIDGAREPVWRIAAKHEHVAAFYRNSVVHAFLETSIIELAMCHAARTETDPVTAFWAQAMRLRDLLKFDFYFADSAAFRAHITEEMAWHSDWEASLRAGSPRIDELLRNKTPLMSPAMLRPFFEAYALVADALRDAPADIPEKELTKYALRLGRQCAAQGRLRSNESVSALLFATARQAMADQGLLKQGADLAARRHNMLAELHGVLDDIDRVEQIARQQFVERRRPRVHATAGDSTQATTRRTRHG